MPSYQTTLKHKRMTTQQTIDIFQQLFNKDIIQIILLYAEPELVLLLQNICPQSLKHIMITLDTIKLIDARNYGFVRKLDIYDIRIFNEIIFVNFRNLAELNCMCCPQITDQDLRYLPLLTKLNCNWCPQITDQGLQYLPLLTKLNCRDCPLITDQGLQYLPLLTELNCAECPQITDQGLQYLPLLTKLDCRGCSLITINMIQIIATRNNSKNQCM